MTNSLLTDTELPTFNTFSIEHVEPAIRQVLAEHRARLQQVLQQEAISWQHWVEPIEAMQHRLARIWSVVGHLNAVQNSAALRKAYNTCLPLITDWNTELGQNVQVFHAYEYILQHEAGTLSTAQQQLLKQALRDFKLAGVALPVEHKARYQELMAQLAAAQAQFDNNVLDATHAWSYTVTDEQQLEGLPAVLKERARQAAAAQQQAGYLFSLDAPNYLAVMTYCDDEAMRRVFYEAWVTRASDQGPHAGQWDNTALMDRILALRHELAQLVGFAHYAEYSLATKMAQSVAEVRAFLEQLAHHSKVVAQAELRELETFAGRPLQAWDVAYYAERLKQRRFSISEEALRPYFPVPQVLQGLFSVASQLYGVRIVARTDVELYHPEVQFFDVLDQDGTRRGGFYVDLYARSHKRGGAWMDECVGRMQIGRNQALPVAYLVCNFMPPAPDHPALLVHSEVVTLFHEFGHGLHHLLTRMDYPSIAGINGVPWDAVELPSQFMEQFAWQPEVLPLVSRHIDTGATLPTRELQRLLDSRTFHAGLHTVRQLEFALLDLCLHAEEQPVQGARVAALLASVRAQVAVLQPPDFNRFANSFQHIFSGGYAAGYYSYKWAEVLAADAFSAFIEQGVFDRATAQRFLQAILEQGGGRDAMESFIAFRGRKPQIEPLLKQQGLAA